MTIDQILNDKGNEVISVGADDTLGAAAKVLDLRRIGAVVALDSGETVIGVLSERDIVRQVARLGHAALEMKVGDAMTRDVVTVPSTMRIDHAMQLMTDRRIRHLPVIRNERLVGFVSIGDLVKWKIAETEAEAEAMKSYLSAQY
ncbi:MAG: inosine-5-monophosphate dehydrogenase [Hyphomonas sp. BRH_c22]|uniref:CBS domain-containing protein n=1 Tax=Hyphomonas sp. BRH_c22 TaxID=1629710 RepID=UPI0005F155EA|nr:CBS domain-containing protein [Hyphomonas sp. BRH_c22]KJS37042.1 MAG: inosine-5-monophosphate dehydrogenase [Hyphomonas sp. BRH_c22]